MSGKAGQLGVEWREGDVEATILKGAVFALNSTNPEAAIKVIFPGRAYWIEIGTDDRWMQTVEYGAFSNKPHKLARRKSEGKSRRPIRRRKNGRGRA